MSPKTEYHRDALALAEMVLEDMTSALARLVIGVPVPAVMSSHGRGLAVFQNEGLCGRDPLGPFRSGGAGGLLPGLAHFPEAGVRVVRAVRVPLEAEGVGELAVGVAAAGSLVHVRAGPTPRAGVDAVDRGGRAELAVAVHGLVVVHSELVLADALAHEVPGDALLLGEARRDVTREALLRLLDGGHGLWGGHSLAQGTDGHVARGRRVVRAEVAARRQAFRRGQVQLEGGDGRLRDGMDRAALGGGRHYLFLSVPQYIFPEK